MNHDWSREQWEALDRQVRKDARSRPSIAACRGARHVLRSFSSSFFLVTRFLPGRKRARVEAIYAAVRYPDEIVDTFPASAGSKRAQLDEWEASYEAALLLPDLRSRMDAGIPWILSGFADVVIADKIPVEHYIAFLDAMRRDIEPGSYRDPDDLTERYIYGSAIVVGYFLACVYGPAAGHSMAEACDEAANLGIALQLTNFCRDVEEDRARGRSYIPMDLVERLGTEGAVASMARFAEERYSRAACTLNVFAEDTRPAIRACIDVYRSLNARILQAGGDVSRRHSVPAAEKFRSLPAGKYWRVPLAYMGAI